MTPRGPYPFGGGPEEPDGARDDDRATGGPLDGNEDTAPNGWIPPEDRPWRHPSEMPIAAGNAGAGGPRRGGPVLPAPAPGGFGRRHRHLATLGVGVGAAAAVVAGVLLLANAGSGSGPMQPSSDDPPSVASAVSGCCKFVPAVARTAQSAMVALEVSTTGGMNLGCGVAVAGGGLVVTTADAVAGARKVTAVTADGRRVGVTVVAVDRDSDLALLQLGIDLPVAEFADDATVAAGRPAMVMALAARPGKDPQGKDRDDATIWSDSTVQSVATAVQGSDAAGLAAVTTGATQVPAMPGSALLAPNGQVIGILDSTGWPAAGAGEEAFLPAQLVVGVAEALASSGEVRHGWLDVTGRDAPVKPTRAGSTTTTGPTTASSTTGPITTGSVTPADDDTSRTSDGALVTKVQSHGASADLLQPGDVIVSVDGAPVRSMAELRTRLYVLRPGNTVQLDVQRGGGVVDVDVTLASSP